ncbi:hypothetical protein Dip518_000173 [Parelusimicrobium proximum]|uniref:hypothetical protein n=1 Tax=Parelusimicrobium proximum TaxID=3228953 RepID=UPI003D16C459
MKNAKIFIILIMIAFTSLILSGVLAYQSYKPAPAAKTKKLPPPFDPGPVAVAAEDDQLGIVLPAQPERSSAPSDPAVVYKTAIELMNKILSAEKEYYAKNGRYTSNIQDLGVYIDGFERSSNIGYGYVYYTKDFKYTLTNSYITAEHARPPSDRHDMYSITFYFNADQKDCSAESEEAALSCLSARGIYASSALRGGVVIKSYILPQMFGGPANIPVSAETQEALYPSFFDDDEPVVGFAAMD